MTVHDLMSGPTSSEEQLRELQEHPDGEYAQSYLTALRQIKPAWRHESDQQLIDRAIRLLKSRIERN